MKKKDEATLHLIREVLGGLQVFRGLTKEQMGRLVMDFSLLRVRKGETIFFQAEDSTDFYVVFEGGVRASLLGSEGQEVILASFGRGDFFGEMSFLDGKPRSATITAEQDAVLGVLKRDKFLLSVKNDPTIALGLLVAMLQRMRTANEMIESFVFLDVNHRLIKLLIQMARTKGERQGEGLYRLGKITHKELAAKIGSSREAVSKALKFLGVEGMVQETGGHFLIFPEAQVYLGEDLDPR